MTSGFLYVLINPTMPGLAKVGKTTRSPSDRVLELSSSSGVPSPFILAFQQPVADCDSAEVWVHRELERGGYRLAENREFFEAPLHTIVQLVAQAADLGAPVQEGHGQATESAKSSALLAQELADLGHAYLWGTNTVLRNRHKALIHFEQAAALGNAESSSLAGALYRWGDSGKGKDPEKALKYFRNAVALGSWRDLAAIAEVFRAEGQAAAAQSHWKQFFEVAEEQFDQLSEVTADQWNSIVGVEGTWYCEAVAAGELERCIDDRVLAHLSRPLLAEIDRQLSKCESDPEEWYREVKGSRLRSARRLVDQAFSSAP